MGCSSTPMTSRSTATVFPFFGEQLQAPKYSGVPNPNRNIETSVSCIDVFASRPLPGQSLLDRRQTSTYKFSADALIQINRVVTRQGANSSTPTHLPHRPRSAESSPVGSARHDRQ